MSCQLIDKDFSFSWTELILCSTRSVLLKYMECNMDAITPLVDEGQIDIVSPESTEKTGITDATAIHIVQLLIPAVSYNLFV